MSRVFDIGDDDLDSIVIAEADVIKMQSYEDPDFDPPCPADHPFAQAAGVLWRIGIRNGRIHGLCEEYSEQLESERPAYIEEMVETILGAVEGRGSD